MSFSWRRIKQATPVRRKQKAAGNDESSVLFEVKPEDREWTAMSPSQCSCPWAVMRADGAKWVVRLGTRLRSQASVLNGIQVGRRVET